MSPKKIETILSLIEVAETNLKNAKTIIKQTFEEKGHKFDFDQLNKTPGLKSNDENDALEVVEGYFDGENMVGDNTQTYPVPQNYASKTQLIIGDRMKWILTTNREIFKLIQPAPRKRVTGTFAIEGDNYVVLVDDFPNPVKILKASATYAIKNLDLKTGDQVAVYIPQNTTPVWGAFISVVKGSEEEKINNSNQKIEAKTSELDSLEEFSLHTEDKKPLTDDIAKKVEDFF